MKRRKLPASESKALFTNTARRPHAKNLQNAPMRGGYRL